MTFFLRRLACFIHSLWSWLAVPVFVGVAGAIGWALLRLLFRFEQYVVAPLYFAFWRKVDERRIVSHPRPVSVDVASLGLEPSQLAALKAKAATTSRVEIGEFDQDGFLLSEYGPIRRIACVTREAFLKRGRSTVRLVLVGDTVVVEKDFRGSKSSFVRELTALRRLNQADCRVPALLAVDFSSCTLTMSFAQGKVLREELAKAGAVLRDRDVEHSGDPDDEGLRLKRIAAGRRVLRQVITVEFVRKLHRALQDVHLVGMTPINIKYGNVIIEDSSGDPCLIDFEGALPLLPCGRFLFNLLRDYDTEEFNLHFGTHHLTYRRIKKRLRHIETTCDVYLGYGLSLGNRRRAVANYCYWRYFTAQQLRSLKGKRILNLDARNGFDAIQLLRLGARQVVAIEPKAELVKEGHFVKQACEWTDNRRYDLKYLQMAVVELLNCDLGRFDVVFAPFGFDGQADVAMEQLMKHLSTIAEVLVCGCNDAPRPGQAKQLIQGRDFRVREFKAVYPEHRPFIIVEPTRRPERATPARPHLEAA